MSSCPRLMVIGIDGASWEQMQPALSAGDLPNIASLIQDGARSDLRSVVPPITGCAWPTMMTGANPGRHGMFGFASYTGDYLPRPLSNADRKRPALWEILNHHDLTTGIYNVPMTYPCDDVDGYMVSGEIGAVGYDQSLTRPRELFDELREAVPRYELKPVVKGLGRDYGLEKLTAQIEARSKAATYLLENHPTDVFIGVVNYVDHVQHRFMKTRGFEGIDDMVLWAYRQADEFVGEVLRYADDDTLVILASDHGAGEISGFLDMDALLCTLGYRSYQMLSDRSHVIRKSLRKVYSRLVKPLLSGEQHNRLRRSAPEWTHGERTNWAESPAYSAGPYGCVRLNLQGREQFGCVAPKDRRAVRDELIGRLNEVVNPYSGEQDLNMQPAENFYSGECAELGPDIVGLPQDFALESVRIRGNREKPFPNHDDIPEKLGGKKMLEGTHRINGVLAIRAPGIAGGITGSPHLTDVAPTVLALLGLPVPSDLDGRVCVDIEHTADEGPSVQRQTSVGEGDGYTDEEAREVEKRLRDLGYM